MISGRGPEPDYVLAGTLVYDTGFPIQWEERAGNPGSNPGGRTTV